MNTEPIYFADTDIFKNFKKSLLYLRESPIKSKRTFTNILKLESSITVQNLFFMKRSISAFSGSKISVAPENRCN